MPTNFFTMMYDKKISEMGMANPEMSSELLCVNNFKRTLKSFLLTIGYFDVVYLLSRASVISSACRA